MVIKLTDRQELVPTKSFPLAEYPFQNFNVVQSRVYEYHDRDCNLVVAVPTSSGKTVCAELVLAHEIRNNKGKGMYLAPLKALAQERVDDWQTNHFKDLKVAICTGDYRLTSSRKREMDEADLIVMSNEMFNSRCRNYKNENNEFLNKVRALVVDEIHILSAASRGDHVESGLMKFTEINPGCRIVGLSATMPNVSEIGEWIEKLNGKETGVLVSSYRPCPLNVHYVKYRKHWRYDENENEKIDEAIRILNQHPKDKFILFVHTKRTGEALFATLKRMNIESEYHNADLTKEKRVEVERRFRTDPKLMAIVATSTVAQGLNLPARRVVVVGVHRGLSEVEPHEIIQEIGRAGRPQYDPQGDAYILLPDKDFDEFKNKIETKTDIRSKLLDTDSLAFHVVSEIHHTNVKNMSDVYDWYDRSLANHQDQSLEENVVNSVVKRLTNSGVMTDKGGKYDVTTVGIVSSMFYFSPFDVADLKSNWNKVFERGEQDDDYWVSMALACINSHRMGIVSAADKDEISKFKNGIGECEEVLTKKGKFTEGTVKAGCCYYSMLKGWTSFSMAAMMRGLQADAERLIEVLCTLDDMTGRWNQRQYFKNLYIRILYGVERELVELVGLRGIGKVKAKRLWDSNIRSLEEVARSGLNVMKSLNCSKAVADQIVRNAKEMLLV